MKLLRENDLRPGELGPTTLTIGNFDGVHRGHQFIIEQLKTTARRRGLPAVALTFDPHPVKLLYPQKGLQLILPFAERARLIERAGVDVLVTAEFTHELSQTPADAWVQKVLLELFQVQELLIGYDFSFGRGRDGDADHLRGLGEKYGFAVHQMAAVIEDGWPISSSRIRRLAAAGEMDTVMKLLGRPFHLRGLVAHGDHRGRGLGFPTANVATPWELIPHVGVYAAVAVVDGQAHAAAVNVGKNPTFDLNELRVEAYLLDFDGALYGAEMELHFVHRLRDEKKFRSVDQLIEAMTRDVEKTRALFAGKPPAAWLP
jgi:riboflavin kinase/FMN adenylyltransferase